MNKQIEQADQADETSLEETESYDYAHVDSVARIALYDDLRSAPRVTEILPAPTGEFIEALASKVYEQAKTSGGTIPYTVIREVSENFIHARFTEATVSILDGGNTIRFADQGPGILHKENAQLPGFTSAIEPMKSYIRGVGSGLPIVKEYLDFSHGTITIEDNLGTGSVVTISLKPIEERSVIPVETAISEAGFHAQDRYEEPYAAEQGFSNAAADPRYPLDYSSQQQRDSHNPAPQDIGGSHASGYYAQPAYGAYPNQQAGAHMGYVPAQPQQAPAYGMPGYQPAAAAGGYGYSPMGAIPAGTPAARPYSVAPLTPPLSQRERDFLPIFLNEGALGVTDLVRLTGVPQSTTYVTLTKLEQAGLVEKTAGQKRMLTEMGYQVAISL